MNFSYSHIKFRKQEEGLGLLVTGEITNNSGRNFHSVVFRVVVYTRCQYRHSPQRFLCWPDQGL